MKNMKNTKIRKEAIKARKQKQAIIDKVKRIQYEFIILAYCFKDNTKQPNLKLSLTQIIITKLYTKKYAQ